MHKLIIFVFIFSVSSASRILFLFPTPTKSHMVIVHSLSTTLAERGHEVTVMSPFPLDEKIKNHREIESLITSEAIEVTNQMIQNSEKYSIDLLKRTITARIDMAVKTVESDEFKKILHEKFDLLIIGIMFHNFLLGYGHILNCPTVMLSIQKHLTISNEIVGNPLEPHSIPYMNMDEEFNFLGRLNNFKRISFDLMLTEYFNYQQKIIYK